MPTQMLIDLSNFMKAWWWALGLGAYGIYFFGSKYVATPNGRRQKDQFLVRAPIFGNLIHKIALSRFCRTYATLMRSGVPILRTLEIVAAASGKVQVEDACVEIAKHVSQGGQVSDIMAANPFFPPMMKHMVKAGETTGNVDGMTDPVLVWRTDDASPSGLAYWQGELWMASLRGARLWQIPLHGDEVGEPVAHFVDEFGRLRSAVPTPDGGALLLTTSNTDGRGDPRDGDDRILRVTR